LNDYSEREAAQTHAHSNWVDTKGFLQKSQAGAEWLHPVKFAKQRSGIREMYYQYIEWMSDECDKEIL